MRGGVVLYFDEATDAEVRRLWALVDELRGGSPLAERLGPHITLLGADGLDQPAFAAGLSVMAAQTAPFPISLSAAATFFGGNGVLYLAPSVTTALADMQDTLVELARDVGCEPWEHFQAGRWVPHCTLAGGLSDELLSEASARVRAASGPLAGRIEALASFELTPGGARERERLPLRGQRA